MRLQEVNGHFLRRILDCFFVWQRLKSFIHINFCSWFSHAW